VRAVKAARKEFGTGGCKPAFVDEIIGMTGGDKGGWWAMGCRIGCGALVRTSDFFVLVCFPRVVSLSVRNNRWALFLYPLWGFQMEANRLRCHPMISNREFRVQSCSFAETLEAMIRKNQHRSLKSIKSFPVSSMAGKGTFFFVPCTVAAN
jgi:hypothetical protein